MWVLEGDEIIAVDGVDCRANIEKIVECIQGSESDSVTLTLSRHYLKVPKGPVKVVFSPSGNMVSVPRGTPLRKAAAMANEILVCEVYKEAGTGKNYEMSKDEAPQAWDNTMPMTLVPAPGETKAKAVDDTLYGGTRVMDSAPGTLPR
ncbi:unnamed protein product [Prorocentrum cordatum]|uniref:PDZ domain-containing protein n=1 Tax=Prorocentrum cordatum TaxID=2364126 RepID=A0ABN9X482_9DINO|nr:unnamed protein product [Polarella glacialis]